MSDSTAFDVPAAMTTRAGKRKGCVAHMKIVSALRASDCSKQCNGGTEKNEPDGKHNTGTAVGVRHLER